MTVLLLPHVIDEKTKASKFLAQGELLLLLLLSYHLVKPALKHRECGSRISALSHFCVTPSTNKL